MVKFDLYLNQSIIICDTNMVKTIYCPNCGDPSPVGQKFCEKCGTQLPTPNEITPTPEAYPNPPSQTNPYSNPQPAYPQPTFNQNSYAQNSYTQTPQPQAPLSLFDPRNMSYVVKEKFWDWGSGPIYDAKGRQIGKMKRQVFSIRKKIEFREMNDRIVGAIHQKILAFKPTYTLVDEHDNQIARLEKKILTFLHPKFYLKDVSGRILMTAIGTFMGFDFKIYHGSVENQNNLVAEIHKADRWHDFFLGGAWDFKDTYGVRIINPNVDRRNVLGFVIAIDNVLHDQ